MDGLISLLTESFAVLSEKGGKDGKIWDVVLIEAGLSANGRLYEPEVLKAAKDLFEGAQCFAYEFASMDKAHHEYNHLPWQLRKAAPAGLAKNLVGDFRNVRFGEYKLGSATKKGLLAEFHCIEEWLSKKLLKAKESGKPAMIGFSIDAEGIGTDIPQGGRIIRKILSIQKVHEVTAVTHPAAGGRVLKLVASIIGEEAIMDLMGLLKSLFGHKCLFEGKLFESEQEVTADTAVSLLEKAVVKVEKDEKEWTKEAGMGTMLKELLGLIKAGDTAKATGLLNKAIAQLGSYPYPPMKDSASKEADAKKVKELEAEVKEVKAKLTKTEEAKKKKDLHIKCEQMISDSKLADRVKEELKGKLTDEMTEEVLTAEIARLEKGLPEASAISKEVKEDVEKMRKELKESKEQLEQVVESERKAQVKLVIEGCRLPKPFKDKVANASEGKTVEQVVTLIESERTALAALNLSEGSGIATQRTQITESEQDKFQKAMDGMLMGETVGGVEPFNSLSHAFRQITGRRDFEPRDVLAEAIMFIPPQARKSKLAESLTTSSFPQILGDSIHRRMVADYKMDDLNVWRKIVSDITSIKDFRFNPRVRMGGYGLLPEVPEQGTYQPLTSPEDEEATYRIKKYGGLEDLTMEMIANDDLGALKKIPQRLGRAAILTLYRAVFDIIRLNPNIYDGNPLFGVGHGNTGALPLNNDNLSAVRKQMRQQQPYDTNQEFLGMLNGPYVLCIPEDLEDIAWKMLTSAVTVGSSEVETSPNIHKKYLKDYIVVPYWTDPTDWCAVANPAMIPTIEVGFYQGKQDPELLVQDTPNVGSVFTADKITYKIRHIWGIVVLDYRGFNKQIVP